MRERLLFLLVGCVALVGCEDERLGVVEGELVFDEVVDFQDVQVGIEATRRLTIRNEGGGVVSVAKIDRDASISGARYAFEAPSAGFEIRGGTAHELTLKFRPFEAMDEPAETVLTLQTDDGPRTLTLKGRGVESGLIVTPNPVDFGTVLIDAVETIEVTITNALPQPTPIFARVSGGIIEVDITSGTGRFDVQATPTSDGSLGTLEPGASMTLPVRYFPQEVSGSRGDRGRFVLSNCGFDLCDVDVVLLGLATDSALRCTPASIDFGAINPQSTRTLTATCENIATETVRVQRLSLDLFSAREFTVALPQVTDVASGESFDVEITFAPTMATLSSGAPAMGTVLVEATTLGGDPLLPIEIAVLGRAGGPKVDVTPLRLDFGLVALGTTHTKRLLVTNTGFDPLVVADVDADTAGTSAFSVSTTSFTLPVGGAQVVEAIFDPQIEGDVASSIVFDTNDLANPTPTVEVTGTGVALPPCVYTVTPPEVRFGQVPLSETPVRGFAIENTGTDACLLSDLDLLPSSSPAPASFTLVDGPLAQRMLMPGDIVNVPVRYAPSRIGTDTATVGFYISDPVDSNPTVRLFGQGEPLLQVACPAPVTTAVGTPVTLTATGQVVGANITGYTWTITSAPTGGQGTPNQWTPDPPTAATEQFLPLLVGTYDLRVDVLDDVNRSSSCVTRVTAEGEGLTTTLHWNGSGDVDLHVHNQVTTSPWFDALNDCYYSNRNPIWDATYGQGLGANPQLDFDNTFANGPENIRISTPVLNQPYTVGVHNYSGAAGRLATIELYCGGVTTPTQVFVSNPLSGTAGGDCTINDFWRVATVTFVTPSTCVITPIDTYGPSAAACTSF